MAKPKTDTYLVTAAAVKMRQGSLDRPEAGIAAAGPRQNTGEDDTDDLSGNSIANLDYGGVKQVGTVFTSGQDLHAEPLRGPVRIQSRARPAQ